MLMPSRAGVMQETIFTPYTVDLIARLPIKIRARSMPIKTVSLRTSTALSRTRQIAFSMVNVHRIRRGSYATDVNVTNYGICFFSVKNALRGGSHVTKCFPSRTLPRMFIMSCCKIKIYVYINVLVYCILCIYIQFIIFFC